MVNRVLSLGLMVCLLAGPVMAQSYTRTQLVTAATGVSALKVLSDGKYNSANGAGTSASAQANAVLPTYDGHELATPGYTVDALLRSNWTALLTSWNIKKANFAIDAGPARSAVATAWGQLNFMQIYGMMPMTQAQIDDQMAKIDVATDAILDLDDISDAFLSAASTCSYNAAKYARLEADDYQAYLYAHSWWP